MRFPLAVSAAAIIAIAVAACTASPPPNFVPPPTGSVPSTGPVTLGAATTTSSAGTAGGVTGLLTFVGGSGPVSPASSSTAPTGTTTVTPADRVRVEASSSPTSPNVYYITITSAAGAKLTGLPGVTLQLSSPAIGTYQEAQFAGGTWTNVPGATAVLNPAGTVVQFPGGNTPVTIPAGGSIFLAFYQGNTPNPTPTPVAPPTNIIADSDFESGSPVPYFVPPGTTATATPNSTQWTQCAVTSANANAGPLIHPFSTFTPVPGSTPGATVSSNGTTIPQGTATPVPSLNAVIVTSGNNAAVLGGLFDAQFRQADLAYNGLCQAITMPKNPTITMNILGTGNETGNPVGSSTDFVNFDVNILDTSGKYLANVYDEQVVTPTSGGDTAYRSVTIPTSLLTQFVGQKVEIFIGIWTKSGGSGGTRFSGYYFVDDFQLKGNP
jgi:hypothetical protein